MKRTSRQVSAAEQPPLAALIKKRHPAPTEKSAGAGCLLFCLNRNDRAAAVAEEALVNRKADVGAFDLASFGLAAELPGELANLRDGLRGDRFAEAGESAGGVHRHLATQLRHAITDQLLGFSFLGDPDVLVPIELKRCGEVVNFRDVDVFGAESGLAVGFAGDGVFEAELWRRHSHR